MLTELGNIFNSLNSFFEFHSLNSLSYRFYEFILHHKEYEEIRLFLTLTIVYRKFESLFNFGMPIVFNKRNDYDIVSIFRG